MSFEPDFRTLLLNADAVADAVGERVVWGEVPQGKEKPLICLWNITRDSQRVMEGPSGFESAYVQIDCWAEKYPEAAQLANAVKAWLEAVQFISEGATRFQGVFFEGRQDYNDPSQGSPAARYARVRLDVTVHFNALDPS